MKKTVNKEQKEKRPSLAADIVLFTILKGKLHVLLIQRKYDPYKGMFALPGGFMKSGETCPEAASRELEEETGVKNISLKIFGVFSDPARDPRGVVSVAHIGFVKAEEVAPKGGDDALLATWKEAKKCKSLAADHNEILSSALEFLKENRYSFNLFLPLLPPRCTAEELRKTLEILCGEKIPKQTFLKILQEKKVCLDIEIPKILKKL